MLANDVIAPCRRRVERHRLFLSLNSMVSRKGEFAMYSHLGAHEVSYLVGDLSLIKSTRTHYLAYTRIAPNSNEHTALVGNAHSGLGAGGESN